MQALISNVQAFSPEKREDGELEVEQVLFNLEELLVVGESDEKVSLEYMKTVPSIFRYQDSLEAAMVKAEAIRRQTQQKRESELTHTPVRASFSNSTTQKEYPTLQTKAWQEFVDTVTDIERVTAMNWSGNVDQCTTVWENALLGQHYNERVHNLIGSRSVSREEYEALSVLEPKYRHYPYIMEKVRYMDRAMLPRADYLDMWQKMHSYPLGEEYPRFLRLGSMDKELMEKNTFALKKKEFPMITIPENLDLGRVDMDPDVQVVRQKNRLWLAPLVATDLVERLDNPLGDLVGQKKMNPVWKLSRGRQSVGQGRYPSQALTSLVVEMEMRSKKWDTKWAVHLLGQQQGETWYHTFQRTSVPSIPWLTTGRHEQRIRRFCGDLADTVTGVNVLIDVGAGDGKVGAWVADSWRLTYHQSKEMYYPHDSKVELPYTHDCDNAVVLLSHVLHHFPSYLSISQFVRRLGRTKNRFVLVRDHDVFDHEDSMWYVLFLHWVYGAREDLRRPYIPPTYLPIAWTWLVSLFGDDYICVKIEQKQDITREFFALFVRKAYSVVPTEILEDDVTSMLDVTFSREGGFV